MVGYKKEERNLWTVMIENVLTVYGSVSPRYSIRFFILKNKFRCSFDTYQSVLYPHSFFKFYF
jgi:hypothetical protein